MKSVLIRSLDVVLLCVWVGVCASVPEIVWQGGKLLFDHSETLEFLISSLLVGMMLAFFVEPLTERLKTHSWSAHHHAQGHAYVSIVVAVLFGMATVCIHQCIDTLLHNKVPSQETTGLQEAIRITVQWSFIPAVFTAVWFIGLRRRLTGNLLVPVASVVAFFVASRLFEWPIYNSISSVTVATLASLLVINLLGGDRAYKDHDINLAVSSGMFFATCTMVLMLTNNYVVKIDYDGLDYGEDVRFYIGWVLGLSLLPVRMRSAEMLNGA